MNVREKIAYLPHDPGVYRYLDAAGTVIYVGKAKDLKRRVTQYFRPPEQLDRKTRALVEHIADLRYTVVETEEDALLLENNLIKQLQPRYNIMLKDDKTYPWICIRKEPFPRVMLTRRYVQDGSLYYGPYASVQHARRLLDLMGSLYKLRICAHPLTDEQIAAGKVRCCLNYHLEKCAGPCEGLFSREAYDAQVEEIKALLSGRTRQLMSACRAKMQEAADILFEYEDFTSFSKVHTQVKTNNCKIMEARWFEQDGLLVFRIKADRFLRNMVRAIVGTLLEIGKGRMTLDEFRAVIERKDRCEAGTSVPAHALFLEDVEYDWVDSPAGNGADVSNIQRRPEGLTNRRLPDAAADNKKEESPFPEGETL